MIRRAAIAYRDGELEACEQGDLWTVRLANLQARARYLDLALAKLLGDASEAHRTAARLLTKLADVAEQQEARAPVQPRTQRPAERRRMWARPLVLGFRVLLFAIISSTAFMLTTWLSTLR
jgi:hypothetical protein